MRVRTWMRRGMTQCTVAHIVSFIVVVVGRGQMRVVRMCASEHA